MKEYDNRPYRYHKTVEKTVIEKKELITHLPEKPLRVRYYPDHLKSEFLWEEWLEDMKFRVPERGRLQIVSPKSEVKQNKKVKETVKTIAKKNRKKDRLYKILNQLILSGQICSSGLIVIAFILGILIEVSSYQIYGSFFKLSSWVALNNMTAFLAIDFMVLSIIGLIMFVLFHEVFPNLLPEKTELSSVF